MTPHFAGGGWLPYLESVYQRQWKHQVQDYWAEIGEFAIRTDPALLICLELHPGTVAYNVETFERLAALSPAIAANIDPSHFFWMQMDCQPRRATACRAYRPCAWQGRGIQRREARAERAARSPLAELRPPRCRGTSRRSAAVMACRGGRSCLTDLAAAGRVKTIAIEHEDPFVAAWNGIREAARLLAEALGSPARARAES